MRFRALSKAFLSFAVFWIVGAQVLGIAGVDDNPWWLLGWEIRAALCVGAAFLIGLHAFRMEGRERIAWLLIGAGVLSWTGGTLYHEAILRPQGEVPIPSPSDIGYLLFVPLVAAGLILRLVPHIARRSRVQLLDGISCALAASAVSLSIGLAAIDHDDPSDIAAVVVASAYPIADALLLGILTASWSLRDWRVDRTSTLVAVALLCFWGADTLYLALVSQGAESDIVDYGWFLPLILLGVAAVGATGSGSATCGHAEPAMRRMIGPVAFAMLALATLCFGAIDRLPVAAVLLAAGSLAVMLVRLALSISENISSLRSSQREASTDTLTSLGNRRALVRDLQATFDSGRAATLALFDLDNFKAYNDAFGHPAGDSLLERLGQRVSALTDGLGSAYRIGGDEFCVLYDDVQQAPILARTAAALSEAGDGFSVTASYGVVELPREARSSEAAMWLVDQRMYARKNAGRASAQTQSSEVLLSAVTARVPQLGDHVANVVAHATRTARALGLSDDRIDRVRTTAMLHDVGKVAIPDSILRKSGALDPSETTYLREHPLAGERIVRSAPALAHVAPLVRSLHERFDGSGYPDQLAGASIPLETRIVTVCDAFDTICGGRPFQAAMSPAEAIIELRRASGTDFDPEIVEQFVRSYLSATLPPAAADEAEPIAAS